MIAAVCKRHGLVACHQCSPPTKLNQVIGQCSKCRNSLPFCTCKYELTKEENDKWNKILKELNNQPIQFLTVWNTNKVIDFVNWYIDLKELGENNKLENKTIVESFLDGDSVDVWKKIKSIPEIFSFLRKNFTYDSKNEIFQSKKRRLGAGTGCDSSLFISSDSGGTLIWWRSNRGEEDTIFDGKELKTEEEFNQIFELLGIKEILKWT